MVSSGISELSTVSGVALLTAALGDTFSGDTAEAETGVDDDTETGTAGSEDTLDDDWVRTGLMVLGVDNIGGGGLTAEDGAAGLTGEGAATTEGVTAGREVTEGLEVVGVAPWLS